MAVSQKQPLNEVYWSKLRLVESNSVNESNSEGSFGVLGTVEGPFAEIENTNRNNRVYSKSLWENVIGSDYVSEMMENKTLLGEGDHPDNRFEISIPEVSHSITDLWIDEANNLVMGKADILDTPVGNIVYTLVEYGSRIGISSRAAGSLKEENGVSKVVEDDYTFFTFDFVPNPGFKTSRLEKEEDNNNSIAANNDRVNEEEDIDFESMRDELMEKIESIKKENISAVEAVVKSLAENNDDYNILIDKIEEKKEDEGKNSTQEDNYSLLEKSYRKVYELETENEEMEEKIADLKDEVNNLSERLEKSANAKSDDIDAEIYKEELKESREKLDKMNSLVKDLKNKLKNNEKKEKEMNNEEVEKVKENLNSKISEMKAEIKEYKRDVKSKELYGELMENRVKEISEAKVKYEKEKTDSKKALEELRDKNNALEEYIISQIAGKTGAGEELVRKYIPENFTADSIVEVEKKIKRDMRFDKKDKKFERPVEVSKEDIDETNEKVTNLSRLVSSVGGK